MWARSFPAGDQGKNPARARRSRLPSGRGRRREAQIFFHFCGRGGEDKRKGEGEASRGGEEEGQEESGMAGEGRREEGGRGGGGEWPHGLAAGASSPIVLQLSFGDLQLRSAVWDRSRASPFAPFLFDSLRRRAAGVGKGGGGARNKTASRPKHFYGGQNDGPARPARRECIVGSGIKAGASRAGSSSPDIKQARS